MSSPGTDPGDDPGGGGSSSLQLVFLVQPGDTREDEQITPPVRVAVRNQSGVLATTFSGEITLAIGNNSGGGKLEGGTRRRVEEGVATFQGLKIDKSGRGYTLVATTNGASSATSRSFDIVEERNDNIVALFDGAGQADTVMATLPVPYEVQVRTSTGLPVAGVSVSWSVTSGTGGVSPATSTTDQNGIARATHRLGDRAGQETVAASVANATGSPVSFTATARHATAAQLAVLQHPTDTHPGQVMTPAVRIVILDQFGNIATSANATAAAGIVPLTGTPGATLAGTLTQPPSGGVFTFPDLRIDLPGLGYRLRIVTGALTIDSAPFTVL
ncbi:MAG: Ig-like domain-containing protein [Gemmatimonadales bacterium]